MTAGSEDGAAAHPTELAAMRARIVGALLWAACAFGLVAYVPSVIASFEGGRWWIAAADTVLYAWIIAVRALPLTSAARAVHIVLIVDVIGAMLLGALGPFGHGLMWLVGATVAAGTLLGARGAAWNVGGQVLAIAATTLALLVVRPTWWIDGAVDEMFPWLAFAGASLFLSASLSLPIARLLAGLETTTERVRAESLQRMRLEQQLQDARKLEAMGTVSGNIAHEFSNLLQPILALSATALASVAPDTPAAGDLREILGAADRARGLVRQMLNYTRKSVEPRSALSLSVTLQELVVLLRASVKRNIRIDLVPVPAGVDDVVDASANELQQVLLNLTLNAAYAMRAAGGVLRISVAACAPGDVPPLATDRGHGFLRIDVADEGTGIDPVAMGHLFEPFFTTKPAREGTGLGLATVHRIVTSMGGAIAVKTAVGAGTTFTIVVPRRA